MKILHSADWHLDSPMQGFSDAQQAKLREELLQIPEKVAALCQKENCDLVLLAGDIFDGAYTKTSYEAVYRALEECGVPVFVTPGNHDYMGLNSPWEQEIWPDNVYVFSSQQVESVAVADLDCRIYGAGFTAMDCPPLMEEFCADGRETYQIGLFHGDPTQVNSPYNPISRSQVENSGLTYLALGHIHKAGSFRAGKTLCAWPGCPMGRGFDETGEKGVFLVEFAGTTVFTQFVPMHSTEFCDLEVNTTDSPRQAMEKILPSVGNDNFYRVTLTGESAGVDIPALLEEFRRFPNLKLRDRTVIPVDLWKNAGQNSFEGVYFSLLQEALEQADPEERETIGLAAEISRMLLEGREVELL